MEKNVYKIFVFFFFLWTFSLTSALITISETNEVYNLGDEITTTLILNPSSTKGDFDFSLICGNSSEKIIFYKGAENYFDIGKEIKINTKIKLERSYIGNLEGNCFLKVVLGSESVSSNKFKISRDINVNSKLDKDSYDPGESILLEIWAIKENGEKLNGFVKGEGVVNFEKAIKEGYLKEVFFTEKTVEAGEYEERISVYDLGEDREINNFKNVTVKIKINQVPSSVPLTISSLELNPGEELKFKGEIYDQSGKPMEGIINVEIISPSKKVVLKKSLKSGEEGSFLFDTNATAGKWSISSSFQGIREEREFVINKKPLIKIEFFNETPIVSFKNVGNDEFIGNVSLEILNETRSLFLNIKPGEERKFSIYAPKGEHNIKIKIGEEDMEKRVFLTGNSIKIKEYNETFFNKPLIIAGIILLILLLVFVLYFKSKSKTFLFKTRKLTEIKNKKELTEFIPIKAESNEAKSSLVLKGEKEIANVIVFRIKGELDSSLKKKIIKIIKELNKYKAAIEFKEEEIITIFSPRKTKTTKNDYQAIRYSLEVSKAIEEINKKIKNKISIGIGINRGEIISNIEGNLLNYTAIGNTLQIARKLSSISENEVLISEDVKKELIREVKLEKKEGFYKVINVLDREVNSEKLRDILRRVGEEKKE
ncbi:MAG: adenylate/guanylate cyclase domain-containing protein [Candidatus Pacearchaeota archaeon]